MKTPIFLLTAALFVFFSCKKDSSDDNDNELLIQQEWKIDRAGVDIDKDGQINTVLQLDDCVFDNTFAFNANGSGVVNERINVCQGASQTSTFSWNLSSDRSTMNISQSSFAELNGQFKLQTLTATKMSLSKDTTAFGMPMAFIVEFKH